jgi:glutathione S-transferase
MSGPGSISGQSGLARPTLIGRSSSSFTRVTRIFAGELGVAYDFEIVRDLLSLQAADYGGNPALKLPSLRTSRGVWFGALNVCRELERMAARPLRTVWPEAHEHPLLANAQELALHAMATAVTLIMQKVGGAAESPHSAKLNRSLLGSLAWLEENVGAALALLPAARELSYLEVTLFCLVSHLEFREVLGPKGAPHAGEPDYPALRRFSEGFAARPSAVATPYRFDA